MPTYWGDADIQAMLDGLGGVPVTVGAVTAKGLYELVDTAQDATTELAVLHAREVTVLVRTTTFAGVLAQGAAITVDGTGYKIAATEQVGDRPGDDGALTRIYCART